METGDSDVICTSPILFSEVLFWLIARQFEPNPSQSGWHHPRALNAIDIKVGHETGCSCVSCLSSLKLPAIALNFCTLWNSSHFSWDFRVWIFLSLFGSSVIHHFAPKGGRVWHAGVFWNKLFQKRLYGNGIQSTHSTCRGNGYVSAFCHNVSRHFAITCVGTLPQRVSAHCHFVYRTDFSCRLSRLFTVILEILVC